ncbi:Uncharacterised protein [Mycoplasmopsis citelli]|uniref:Uncharacterized protein n=1 Tax=Mycoplasmopsis citelli TaxID=171281 RepID=A0A449B159_9BACT|nr:hypothetical protein [Mycoplasmopsis citelli]VEU74275.1 Uncharacterised protein [Mycoplasmopsis citelli]
MKKEWIEYAKKYNIVEDKLDPNFDIKAYNDFEYTTQMTPEESKNYQRYRKYYDYRTDEDIIEEQYQRYKEKESDSEDNHLLYQKYLEDQNVEKQEDNEEEIKQHKPKVPVLGM